MKNVFQVALLFILSSSVYANVSDKQQSKKANSVLTPWFEIDVGEPNIMQLRKALRRIVETEGVDFEAKGNIEGRTWTLAHYAVFLGDIEILKTLKDRGVDFEIKDNEGRTVAHWAAIQGHSEVLKLGVNLEARDISGRTPAHYAAKEGHLEVLITIKDLALVRLTKDLGGFHFFSGKLFPSGMGFEARDHQGRTPIHWAAKQGRYEILRYFGHQGVSLEARDIRGETPVFAAYIDLGSLMTLKDLGADLKTKNKWQNTVAHMSATEGDPEILKFLKNEGVDLEARDSLFGNTPGHEAAYWGNLEFLVTLKGLGVDLGIRNKNGKTPLDLLSREKLQEFNRLLDKKETPCY